MKEVTVYNLRGNVQSIKHTLNNIAAMLPKGTKLYAFGTDAENNVVWEVFPGQSADYMEHISFKGIKMVEVGYEFPEFDNPLVDIYTDSQVMLDKFLDDEDEVTFLGNATKLYVRGYAEQKLEAERFENYMEAKEEFGSEDVVIIKDHGVCYTFGVEAVLFAQATGITLGKSVSGKQCVCFPAEELDDLVDRAGRNYCKAYTYYVG